MAGEVRKAQIKEPFEVTPVELEEIDGDQQRILNVDADSLTAEVQSRLLSPATEWSSQKQGLEASEAPSGNNPYVTLNQMNREISLGEFSTWRFPVDSASDLSAFDAANNHDGDCRLVKGVGIYEWLSGSQAWSPILEVGNLFNSTATATIHSGESVTVEHDPDANFTRIVQASQKTADGEDASSEQNLWRGLSETTAPLADGAAALTSETGPGSDPGQGKLARDAASDPFGTWTKGLQGLRAVFGTGEVERILFTEVTDENTAWLQYGSVPVAPGSSSKTEVDPYTFDSGSYEATSIEPYNDIRLVERFLWDPSVEVSSATPDSSKLSLRTLYSRDQTYIFIVYIDSSLGGGAIVYYNVNAGTYSDPILVASGAKEIDACIHASPYSSSDEVRLAYLEADNSIKYVTYRISTGLTSPESVTGATDNRSNMKIFQQGNLQPVIATKEGTYNTLIYWCRKDDTTWLQAATSQNNIKGFDVSAAPGLVVAYVDRNSTGAGNGTSWDDAFTDLADALDSVIGYAEVWVAAGEYYPSSSVEGSFQMEEGVEVYGGFDGTETSRDQRDWTTNLTILNGRGINYHVVLGSDNSVIDGFIIKGGNASGSGANSYGGGMYNKEASPVIRNCSFVDNKGIGAIYNEDGSVEVRECSFHSNLSTNGNGGAIHNGDQAALKLYNSVLVANTAKLGGGLYHSSTATSVEIVGSTLYGNYASAGDGDAIVVEGPLGTMDNSIVWGTGAAADASVDVKGAGSFTVAYSNVVGSGGSVSWVASFGIDGGLNIDTDPLFLNPDQPTGPDDVYATRDDGLRLTITSPCLDTGSAGVPVEYDILGSPRDAAGGGFDMGAYEGGTSGGDVKYVDPSATGAADGTTWDNAYTNLSTALGAVSSGEVWVAQGTYTPANVASSFTLPANVHVYGGFVGTEVSRDERDWRNNETILSGLISGDYCENGIVIGATDARLDGFVIENGRSTSSGGGMVNSSVSPTIANCSFRTNTATSHGGGIYNSGTSAPIIQNTDFVSNTATGDGGAIDYEVGTAASLDKCAFFDNSSANGGAIAFKTNDASVETSSFLSNSAGEVGGGAVYVNYSSGSDDIAFMNCTMLNNQVDIEEEEDPSNLGSYWYFRDGSSISVMSGDILLENTILWNVYDGSKDRFSEIFVEAGANVRLKKNDIYHPSYPITTWGGHGVDGAYTDQGGNISKDPKFVDQDAVTIGDDPYGPDGILKTDDDPVFLENDSPCISQSSASGAPNLDIRGAVRDPNSEGLVDMGAYEFAGEHPPLVPDPDFGMITQSKFGVLVAGSDGKLLFDEFTWDGTTRTAVREIDLSDGTDGVVNADQESSIGYWSDGREYKTVFHFIGTTNDKVKQAILGPAESSTEWQTESVTESSETIRISSSMDQRAISLIRQSGVVDGRFHHHHSRFGWDFSRGTGDFVLSPPFPVTRIVLKETAIDIAEPATHNSNGPSLVAYIKDSDNSLSFRVSSPFYSYDNWSVSGPTEDDTTQDKPSSRSTPLAYHETSSSLWIFGGKGVSSKNHPPGFVGQIGLLSGLWKFNLATEQWSRVNPSIEIPARSDHAFSTSTSFLNVVGGYSTLGTELETRVYQINWASGETINVGDLAKGFAEAGFAQLSDDLFVFGGMRVSGTSLAISDSILKIDVTSQTSGVISCPELTATGSSIPALESPSCVAGKDSVGSDVIFVYGGYDGVQLRNEIYQITISGSSYTLATLSTDGERKKGASISYYESGSARFLVVFGGQINEDDNSPTYTDDVMLFNLTTNQWLDISPNSGESPNSAAYCGISAMIGSDFYLFGGLDATARGANFTIFKYTMPTINDGVLDPSYGNVTKKSGRIWIQAIDTASMKSIEQVSISTEGYSQPAGTTIRLAVGFGQAGSAWVIENGVWVAIADEDIHDSGMVITDFNAITSVAWGDKFRPGIHQSIYLLVGMTTARNHKTPSVSSVLVDYKTPETYKVVGHDTVEITMSGVQETTVKNISGDSEPKILNISIMAERS